MFARSARSWRSRSGHGRQIRYDYRPHSGRILYEKNADEMRAPPSTQKLLTALIVAEHGMLDQPVRVETIDTLAEPVKLNIKPGDTYQRIDLLRALLVQKPKRRGALSGARSRQKASKPSQKK